MLHGVGMADIFFWMCSKGSGKAGFLPRIDHGRSIIDGYFDPPGALIADNESKIVPISVVEPIGMVERRTLGSPGFGQTTGLRRRVFQLLHSG